MPSCLYCHRALPGNDAIEPFPYARRVAYDPARMRYWVVCTKCGKWSLAPLEDEERATTIEGLERWWRSSSRHYSTGGIGLGEYSPKLSVVRIGDWSWREFAFWRHASVMRRRRRKQHLAWGWVAASAGAFYGLGLINAGAGFSMLLTGWAVTRYQRWRRKQLCRIPAANGTRAVMREGHLFNMELAKRSSGQWSVNVEHDDGVSALSGAEGIRALGYALPYFNMSGAREKQIEDALELVSSSGGPEALAERAAEPVPPGSRHYTSAGRLGRYPTVVRTALEMATQEHAERRLVENELALLRSEWREAEEIANVAAKL